VEIISQLVTKEQAPKALELGHVEEEVELQQLENKNIGKEIFQDHFKEKPICDVILQRLRSRTKAMMKIKGKALIEKHVEKHVKKKTTSKVN
jgi:hypothetical protein